MTSEYSITITKAPKVTPNTQDEEDRDYTLPYFDDQLDSRHILNLFVDEEDLEKDLLAHLSVDEDMAVDEDTEKEEQYETFSQGNSFRQWRIFLDEVYDAIGDDKYQDIADFIDNYLEHVKLQRGSKEPVTFLYDFKTNTTSYTDAQYAWLDNLNTSRDNWWCQPYVLLKIYYGVYKIYEKEEEELRYQLEIKEEDRVKNIVSLVTRTTHQTPIMGDTLAVNNWVDREQATDTDTMEIHYTINPVIETEHHEGNSRPRWKSNHVRKIKNAILTARKKITVINEKVPIMEAIVNESNDEVIDHSPEDVAEAKHFLSRYRTRLRLNEQVLTASQARLNEQVGIPTRSGPPEQNAWDWKNDPRLKEVQRLISEADEKTRRDRYITENKGRILKEWYTLSKETITDYRKEGKSKALVTRLKLFLKSLVSDGAEIWEVRPPSLKNYKSSKLEKWTSQQPELQQQQSVPTPPVPADSMMMTTPGGAQEENTQEEQPKKHGSPGREALFGAVAGMKRARELGTTPQTGAKRAPKRAPKRARILWKRTTKRGIEEVVFGGFRKSRDRNSPKKRRNLGKLPGGWVQKTNRLTSPFPDGGGPLLKRSGSL